MHSQCLVRGLGQLLLSLLAGPVCPKEYSEKRMLRDDQVLPVLLPKPLYEQPPTSNSRQYSPYRHLTSFSIDGLFLITANSILGKAGG
eukprot:g17002.t1